MDDLQEIMEDFLIEAFEMNEQLDQDLVELEHNPEVWTCSIAFLESPTPLKALARF